MTESKRHREVPQRTVALLHSLIRSSATGPVQVDLAPWLPAPLTCFPNVAPVLPTSRCFLEFLSTQDIEGHDVLDFGSGSGVLTAFACRLKANLVDAIDINSSANIATRDNAAKLGFADRVRTIHSNGFAQVEGRYDLIVANLPIVEADSLAGVVFGLFDPDYSLHRHFFSKLCRHLKPGGSALVCHAELQAEWPFSRVESIARQCGIAQEIAFERSVEGTAWRLYRMQPNHEH